MYDYQRCRSTVNIHLMTNTVVQEQTLQPHPTLDLARCQQSFVRPPLYPYVLYSEALCSHLASAKNPEVLTKTVIQPNLHNDGHQRCQLLHTIQKLSCIRRVLNNTFERQRHHQASCITTSSWTTGDAWGACLSFIWSTRKDSVALFSSHLQTAVSEDCIGTARRTHSFTIRFSNSPKAFCSARNTPACSPARSRR